jgi:hypothetical protein
MILGMAGQSEKLGDQVQRRLQAVMMDTTVMRKQAANPSAVYIGTPDEQWEFVYTSIVALCEEIVMLGYEIDALSAGGETGKVSDDPAIDRAKNH